MKKHFFLTLLAALATLITTAQTGIGTTTPDSSAALEIRSSDKGVLLPRLSTLARLAINNPADGLMVFDSTLHQLFIYTTTPPGWQPMISAGYRYFFRDKDGDGYGDLFFPVLGTYAPTGFVADSADCNDDFVSVHPGALEVCNGRDDNCDGQTDEGFNLVSDPLNCGSCGINCNGAPNATTDCINGNCTVTSCNVPFADCNGVASDGCEINLLTNLSNCGACGVVCSFPNAEAACSGGMCVINSCVTGWANLDGITANGCESNLDDLHILTLNGTSITGCATGWSDCDGIAANGCEVDILSTASACGSCSHSCTPVANATIGCVDGNCAIAGCNAGWSDCNGILADGCEINLMTSLSNCGSCGFVCSFPNAVAACSGGSCVINNCLPGWADLDGITANGCESNLNDLHISSVNGSVITGCATGWADCDNIAANGCECTAP